MSTQQPDDDVVGRGEALASAIVLAAIASLFWFGVGWILGATIGVPLW